MTSPTRRTPDAYAILARVYPDAYKHMRELARDPVVAKWTCKQQIDQARGHAYQVAARASKGDAQLRRVMSRSLFVTWRESWKGCRG